MSGGSYFLDTRSHPLVVPNHSYLNKRLQTQYVDVRVDDQSFGAACTRISAEIVGGLFTPRQVLAILRVLKAITLCFIVLTFMADIMYILFVDVLAGKVVRQMAGGWRDILIRLYALLLLAIALAIETDYSKVAKQFSGLKAFFPRAQLYLFVALITASHPEIRGSVQGAQSENAYADGNDANAGDDAYEQDDNAAAYYELSSVDLPTSAVGFQRVTSFVLGCCAIAYFVCGVLCFDRFTARAFLSDRDPRVTTAIPTMDAPGLTKKDPPEMEDTSPDQPDESDEATGDCRW